MVDSHDESGVVVVGDVMELAEDLRYRYCMLLEFPKCSVYSR